VPSLAFDDELFGKLHIQKQISADLAFDFGRDFIDSVVNRADIKPKPSYKMRDGKEI
jgi:hypothetical protein